MGNKYGSRYSGCDLRRGAAVGVSVWVWGSRLAIIGQRSVAQPAVAAHGTPAEGGRPRGASLTWHPKVPVRSRAPMDRAVCSPGR